MRLKINRLLSKCLLLVCLMSNVVFLGASAETRASATFKIGAIIPLTGPLADYGQAVRAGFELAQRDRPAWFQNVEIIYQDSSYDGKTSLNAFNALFARGDINLYYVWGVTPNETLLPILSARGLPVISETTIKSSMVGKPLAVRMAPTGEMTARVLADEIVQLGYRKLGLLLVDIPYYRDIYESLKVFLEKERINLDLIDTVPLDMSDLRTAITRIKAKNYDAVGVFLLNDQVISYYRQAATLKYFEPTFGASIHDSQKLISSAGAGAEGAIFVGYDVSPDFRQRWLDMFKDDSRIGCGANAYDTAEMLGDIFNKEGSFRLSALEIVQRLASVKKRTGVSGEFGFKETPDAGKHIDLLLSARIVKNGIIQVLNRPDSHATKALDMHK